MSRSINSIFIEELEVHASVGIYDHEKANRQNLLISLNAECLKDKTFDSDDINDTINYEKIIGVISAAVEQQHYNLIETLAEKIATNILAISGIYAITVEIRKPSVLGDISKGILGIRIKRGAPSSTN